MKDLDLRVQKTYLALIHAFQDLLKENEVEEISVTELCENAMIRQPTFYKHFLDKYDFLTFFIKDKMNHIFDQALKELEMTGGNQSHFFVLVFEQLLDQPDNILSLIFRLQMSSDIMIELKTVQEYGQKMLKEQLKDDETHVKSAIKEEYQAQIIMGITIQTVHWYKNHQEKVSREEVSQLYKESLEKLT